MRSLRGRILLHLGVAVVLSTVLTVVVAAILVRDDVHDQALRGLERQAEVADAAGLAQRRGARGRRAGAAGAASARAGTARIPADGRRVFFARRGRPRAAGPRVAAAIAAAVPAGERSGRVEVADRALLYAARGEVILVRGARLASADWRPFLSSLLIAGAGGALVAAALAALLARRLTRPLRDLAAAARRLAGGDRGARVPVRGRDELAAVGASFNAMAEELTAVQTAEREFLMSVSHELKTPLTAIAGYSEALCDGAVPSDEAGAVIGAEAQRLERLVRDLLDLARLDRRAFAVAREPVDLGEVARRAGARAQPRARDLGIHVEVRAAEGAWATGDDGRLLQAASNLVDNALRVTPKGGRVAIEARPGALSVADTGPGLRPEDLPRAFDRFHLHARYGACRTDGSGLGLAIVHELAAAMGGRAEVESRAGTGARFTIRLPGAPQGTRRRRQSPRDCT